MKAAPVESYNSVRGYRFGFAEDIPEDTTIEVLRGKEGYRVRQAY
ncbi:MAG: hypothetical protein V3V10_10075 [Planctomycetota bacterium]